MKTKQKTLTSQACNWRMKLRLYSLLLVLLCLTIPVLCVDKYSRHDFPPGFVFGASTTAYQVEGAANEDGRTPSVWDTFAHQGNVAGGATGDVAADQYHKYKEDVQLMVETGLDAYKFSISWTRIIPDGRGQVNPKGIEYYNHLINELISHGIQPHVLLGNYDHPQALEDEYGGWVSRKIVEDFTEYADVCFREFGDRVMYWTTVNEPNVMAVQSYDKGLLPPKRCSQPFGTNCSSGNSSSEPYLAAYHLLLAHASAARLYKEKYQHKQHGLVGISVHVPCFVPQTDSVEDAIATQRAYDFFVGWFLDPLVFGDYPKIMKKNVGSRLPVLTTEESQLVKGSFDFIGVIHYTIIKIKDNSNSLKLEVRDFNADLAAYVIFDWDNLPPSGFPITPQGLHDVLDYLKQTYGNPPIYIHENGQMTRRNSTLKDISRVQYLHAYIGSLLEAVRNGSNARGYFMWSFLDLFELLDGYESGYGLYYVDLDDPDLKRYAKLSAQWYSQFLKGRIIDSGIISELDEDSRLLPIKRSYQ